jgi:hypothetical protein
MRLYEGRGDLEQYAHGDGDRDVVVGEPGSSGGIDAKHDDGGDIGNPDDGTVCNELYHYCKQQRRLDNGGNVDYGEPRGSDGVELLDYFLRLYERRGYCEQRAHSNRYGDVVVSEPGSSDGVDAEHDDGFDIGHAVRSAIGDGIHNHSEQQRWLDNGGSVHHGELCCSHGSQLYDNLMRLHEGCGDRKQCADGYGDRDNMVGKSYTSRRIDAECDDWCYIRHAYGVTICNELFDYRK